MRWGKNQAEPWPMHFRKHWTITAAPSYTKASRKTKMWIFPSKHTDSQEYRPLTQQWVHSGKSGLEITGRHHSRSEDGVKNSTLGRREQKGLPAEIMPEGALQAVSIPIAKWWGQEVAGSAADGVGNRGGGVGSRRVLWAATTKGFIYQDKRDIWWSSG